MNDPKNASRFSGNKSTGTMADALFRARRSSEAESAQSQDLNRGWWERLPMTYAEWSTEDRTPKTRAAPCTAVRTDQAANPSAMIVRRE